jgi:hypothetical protein
MRPTAARFLSGSLLLLLGAVGHAGARCGDGPGDAAAIAAARTQIETDCNCAGAPSHGVYVRCASRVVNQRAGAGTLRRVCKGTVVRCVGRSTCGKPGFVTCCRPAARGGTRCTIRAAGHCAAGSCAGSIPSCCDACGADGCVTTTTTTTTSTTLPILPTPCTGGSPEPVCDGSCPAGQDCGLDVDLTGGTPLSCACYPSGVTPCGASAYPQCGGACFGDAVCQAFHQVATPQEPDLHICACVPAGSACEGASSFPPFCHSVGICPPGLACTVAVFPAFTECGCGNL